METQGRLAGLSSRSGLPEATAAYAAGPRLPTRIGEGVAGLCFGFVLEWFIALHAVSAPGCVETQDWLSELAS